MTLSKRIVQTLAGGVVAGLMVCAAPVFARDTMPEEGGIPNEVPKQLEGIGITEHLGSRINLDLPVKNEAGQTVPLRSYFHDNKPVLLSLAYYNCPSLCNFHLNGLLEAFKGMKQPLGSDFNMLVVSIDPRETPALATAKRESYLKVYNRPEGNDGWHFAVADQKTITELASEVGFGFRWDEEEKQFAHASAAYVLTPDGTISRYLYGIVFNPQTIRLSVVEASSGHVGSVIDKLTLYCFHFDPKASKYTLAAFSLVRAGGVLIVALLAMFLTPFWWRSRRDGHGGSGPSGGSSSHA